MSLRPLRLSSRGSKEADHARAVYLPFHSMLKAGATTILVMLATTPPRFQQVRLGRITCRLMVAGCLSRRAIRREPAATHTTVAPGPAVTSSVPPALQLPARPRKRQLCIRLAPIASAEFPQCGIQRVRCNSRHSAWQQPEREPPRGKHFSIAHS
jgi:hypothetical protein